jgi:hypothetical protein
MKPGKPDRTADGIAQSLEGLEDDTDEGAEAPEQPESVTEEDEEEVPTEYMGHDLAHLPSDARQEVINVLKEQDRVVNRRMQEIADDRKKLAEEARTRRPALESQEVEVEQELDLDQIAESLGIDTKHAYYEDLKPFLSPILGKLYESENKLSEWEQASTARTWEQEFDGKLSSLQKDFGTLPYDLDTIKEAAIENNVFDANAIYWSVMGPLQHKAADEFRKRSGTQKDALRDLKKGLSSTKARSSARGTTSAQGKPKNILEAFELAKAQHGGDSLYVP